MRLRPLARAGAIATLALIATTADAQTANAPPPDVAILAVIINGIETEQPTLFLRRRDGLWARAADLEAWRILRPKTEPITVDGQTYLPLSAMAGVRADIDETAQTVKLFVPAERFARQNFSANPLRASRTTAAIPAGFVNYNIIGEAGSGFARLTGFFDAGFSNRRGLVETTFTLGKVGQGSAATRLDSFFLRDYAADATRLVIGDAITATSSWSRPIRYGGVKFGTDFGLRPGFITFPTADFEGRTLIPSSVEFYANGALRYRGDVDRGPFAIDQAPLPVGAGLLTVVTRDILGVERRTTTPYYVSANLLRAGLSRYSFEIGEERDDYGIRSFSYSRPFVSGTYRRGINSQLTLEGRAEIGSKVQDGGISFASTLPRIGEFGATAAISTSADGNGMLYGAYFSRVSTVWDIGLNIQKTNAAFSQLGIRDPLEKILRQVQGNAGVTLRSAGRIGVSIAEIRNGVDSDVRVVSLTYNITLGRLGYLDAFALHVTSSRSPNNSGLGIGLSIPFGPRGTARGGTQIQNGRLGATADLRKAPPNDNGWGYGASVQLGGLDQQRADATWRGNSSEIRAEVARFQGESGARIGAEGGLAFANGAVFATRRLDGAFGIVDAAGYPGVRVYQDNRPLTKTNAKGLAIIPSLRPYQENAIRLSPDDMPIGARVDADDVILIPSYRAGVLAQFAVRTGHPATVLLRLADGSPVPAGAAVTVDGDREHTFAGYDGAVFIADLKPTMELRADIPGQGVCVANVSAPNAIKLDLPEIGPIDCIASGPRK